MKKSPSKFVKNLQNPSYSHTDLACEAPSDCKNARGVHIRDFCVSGYDAAELEVTTKEAEDATGRPIGRYVTLHCPDMTCPETIDRESLSDALHMLLSDFIKRSGFEIAGSLTVLIAGLGNRFITADSIGPRVSDKVLATAHLNKNNKAFASLGIPSISVISPGVSSQTGIESADIIKAAAKTAKADFIIAIDALAARSTARLCATVQISDSGISPGSGIGNHRTAITEDTMGLPVIAIGIPTVISSATLIYDALTKTGAKELTPQLKEILDASDGFFVSPGESDSICEGAADIIASAIAKIFTDKLYA